MQKSPICRQPYPTTAVRAAERANDDPADRARPSAVARDQHSTIAEALAVTPGQAARREAGAVAVEFALLLPLLMLFLFGIIQYGYGLFQLQTFNSTVSDSARSLATGITGCSAFDSTLNTLVSGNGLDPAAISDVQVAWVNADGSPLPQRLGYAKLTVSYTPFKIGIPFIPFPNKFTRTRIVAIQDIQNTSLTGCLLP